MENYTIPGINHSYLKISFYDVERALVPSVLLLGVAAILFFAFRFHYRQPGYGKANAFPDPPEFPVNYITYFRRNVLQPGPKSNRPRKRSHMDALTATMNRSGWDTIQWRFLGSKTIMTRDPRNIQAMLATQFKEFGLGRSKYNFRTAIGRGIFSADGEEWELYRSTMRRYFMTENFKRADFEPHTRKLMAQLPVGDDGWTKTLDLQKLFYRFAMEVSADLFFGLDLSPEAIAQEKGPSGSISKDFEANISAFSVAFQTVQQYLATRVRLGWIYAVYDGLTFRHSIQHIYSFAQAITTAALETYPSRPLHARDDDEPNRTTLVRQIVSQNANDHNASTHSQVLHIIIASRDTTAVTLSWLFHNLARNPAIYAELREEVLTNFGPYNPASPPANATASGLKSCQSLQNVLLETMRLHPAISGNSRAAVQDTTLPSGGGPDGTKPIRLRRGDEVLYSVYAMHRNPALWGADAEVFRPGRWRNRKASGQWDYLPFNGGPRVCIGQNLAVTEMAYVVVRIVQRFESVESRDEVQEAVPKITLINSSARGVIVRLRDGTR